MSRPPGAARTARTAFQSLVERICRAGMAGLVLVGLAQAAEPGGETRIILQTSPLAGFQHYAGAALFPLMGVGQTLTLGREPANPHDPKAVRVEWFGVQIGYAPKADNVDLARLMDRGFPVEARILHLQKSRDPWKRVLMEIYILDQEKPGQPR